MIFKESAMATILFFSKSGQNFHRQNICRFKDFHGLYLHSESVGPIIRDISGHVIVLIPFGFEAGVKGQIDIWKRFPGHDFLYIVFILHVQTPSSNDNGDRRSF